MIKVSAKTTVKNKLRYERARRVRTLDGAELAVGVKKVEEYPDGTPVWKVALWNEYGTDTIPERSFIRSTMNENAAMLQRWRRELSDKMVRKGWTAEKALDALGQRVVFLIQAKIMSDVLPENAESTKARKRRLGVALRTLVETGRLHDSITHTVIPSSKPPPKQLKLGRAIDG